MTGDVKLTDGFQLPTRYIIHTVGPVWQGGQADEPQLLARCYHRAIRLAEQHALHSIAFPAISCGVYGYPPAQAVPLAVASVRTALSSKTSLRRVIFCCFDDVMAMRYRQWLTE